MPDIDEEEQYTTEEYEFLRKVALSLIELRDLHSTSARARNLEQVLYDLKSMVNEYIDEF
jgi:hypothetical protein